MTDQATTGGELTPLQEQLLKFLRFERVPVCFTAHIVGRLYPKWQQPQWDSVLEALEQLEAMCRVKSYRIAGATAWMLTKPRREVKL